jgi:hypothetical protein
MVENPKRRMWSSAFFLLAKKSRYAENWLVYFWRERLPLATEGSFSPEGKTLVVIKSQSWGELGIITANGRLLYKIYSVSFLAGVIISLI